MRTWVAAGLLGIALASVVVAPARGAPVSTLSVAVLESPGGVATAFQVDGGLLTAAHAAQETPLIVVIDGRRMPVQVSRIDERRDLALLTGATTPGGALALASREPVPGETVLAYGNGLGQGRIAVKQGIVSAVGSNAGIEVVETDAAVNPGDSGGPLVAADGTVIAVIMAKGKGEGAALAVTASEVRAFLASAASAPTSGAPPATAREKGPAWLGPVAAGIALAAAAAGGWLWARRRRARSRPLPRILIVLDAEPESAGPVIDERSPTWLT